ncbi:hypothetical protein WKW50_19270 [Ochrobactrum sp. GPK 3]|uniref:hypothetical protein n=1 Tax=Brucella sp. 22210 TaxID=3453892 RepID=UPI0031384F28
MEWETLNKGSVASPMSIACHWGNTQFNGLVCLPVGAVAWAAEDEFTADRIYLNRRFVTNICCVFPGFSVSVTNCYSAKNILKNIDAFIKMITDG